MLRKIHKKYIYFIESLPGKHHYLKMFFAEHLALFRKKKLINSVQWSKQQKYDFSNFWKTNYKNINSNGNKLYEAINGIYHKDYIPDFLYATKIESNLNNYQYARIFSDKALTEVLYKNKSEILLPKTFLLKASGTYYDEDRNVIDIETAKNILLSINQAVIKPTIDGNSGKGVVVGDFTENGKDRNSNFNILSLLDDSHDNLIVQEKVEQSEDLSKIFSNSVNTFRLITYLIDNKINVGPLSCRIGSGTSKIDNIHAGGLVVGVNMSNGTLKKYAYKLGYSNSKIRYEKHPDSNIVFNGYKIEGINKMIDSAKKLHGYTPHIGIISWDLTLNKDNIPVLIEANYTGQSLWFPQIVNSEPFFGDETPKILKIINKK